MEEWLDIYDDERHWIGCQEREAVHRLGFWHQTFDCWLVRPDPVPRVLFQRRSLAKLDYPGLWDTSVGGHIQAGESVSDGVREIREELGVEVAWSAVHPLGTRVKASSTLGRRDYEFQEVHLVELALDGCAFAPDWAEVSGLTWIGVAEGLAFFQGRQPSIEAEIYHGVAGLGTETLRIEDFVPCLDRYYQRVLIMAERYLAGYVDLAI